MWFPADRRESGRAFWTCWFQNKRPPEGFTLNCESPPARNRRS